MVTCDLNKISLTKALLEHVTQTIYERGLEYFEKGAVKDLKVGIEQTLAKVEGRKDYNVEIGLKKGALGADCDCPYMLQTEDEYCKHIIAVAIAHDKKLKLALPTLDHIKHVSIEEIPHLNRGQFSDRHSFDKNIFFR